MHMLIVDDCDHLRRLMAHTLQSVGIEVTQAAGGVEALAKLGERPLDAVMTDINMPGLDGLAFIERAREHPAGRTLPVFVLSSDECPAKMERARRAGVSAWLGKPMAPPLLAALMLSLAPASTTVLPG